VTGSQPAPPESWRITTEELFSLDGSPRNAAIAQLIADLESPNGEGTPFTKQELIDLISRPEAQIVYSDKILKYATPVSLDIQKKEHEDYTKIFMKESYQKAGLEFLKTHREYLDRAEQEYGVLRRDIVSVLIWESGLGKFTGDFREFNVFLGLLLFLDRAQESAVQKMIAEGKPNPLDDPARAEKERKRLDKRKAESARNLVALLRMSKQIDADPLAITGSWGGAIGYVQFMPSNLKYAVDGDGDGKVNLSTWPDAIMSVAYYLRNLGNYESTEAGRQRALLRYNPSKEYANGVKLVAETIWRRHLNGE
jgi:membrane-bound lytic murein transglycosylase B